MRFTFKNVLGFLLGMVLGFCFFGSFAFGQDELSRVVNSNVRIIERNHVRGDMANARARVHEIIYHQQYGWGYYDDGYFFGTDQYGGGYRGRVRISEWEVGLGGAAVCGAATGDLKWAVACGAGGYFGTKAVKAIVQHKSNKKIEKEAEAMAAQAEAEAQAMLEKKFFWNDTESLTAGVFYQDNSGTQYIRVGPGQRVVLFILPGSNVGVMAEGVITPSGRPINKEIPYGKGKQYLPNNAGWRIFNVKLDQLDW